MNNVPTRVIKIAPPKPIVPGAPLPRPVAYTVMQGRPVPRAPATSAPESAPSNTPATGPRAPAPSAPGSAPSDTPATGPTFGQARRHKLMHGGFLVGHGLLAFAVFAVPLLVRRRAWTAAWLALGAIALTLILIQALSLLRYRAMVRKEAAMLRLDRIEPTELEFDRPLETPV